MSFFDIQMENTSTDEITMKYISFFINSYNPANFILNTRNYTTIS